MIGKYEVAHLLGITRYHEPKFRQVERELTQRGYICFAPAIYNYDIYLNHKNMLNDMCYQKLLVCDFCVLVTPEHVGKSTSNRIRQAMELSIDVYVWDYEHNSLGYLIENERMLQKLIDESILFDNLNKY